MRSLLINFSYIAASILFIFGLKMLSSQKTARWGNLVSALGMLVAVIATLLVQGMSFAWIAVGLVIGSAVGTIGAYAVPMTALPEMVALFNGFGGLASVLVAWADYHTYRAHYTSFTATATILTVLIGAVTFSGSLVAYMKLAETFIGGKPILLRNRNVLGAALLALLLAATAVFTLFPQAASAYPLLLLALGVSLLLGVLSVLPIGGADMPVVISLLNSYSGMAACAAGFVLMNNVLIVAGALVGASGIILTQIMCKSMNRTLSHVLFSGFGSGGATSGASYQGEARAITADNAYLILEAARKVIIVPGYGMAVAQAQHAVRELGDLLEANGAEVQYAIHPVAGRMPGHMNVLLAEADVPYEQLVVPEDVNPVISSVDVALVIGANDVVNPAAREDAASPLYGMPIINVDQAHTCIVMKRSLASGYAGVDNPLFFKQNTRMLFGDAKATAQALVSGFKGR